MGTCEPGQGRKSAAISSHPHVWWASRQGPIQGEPHAPRLSQAQAFLELAATGER